MDFELGLKLSREADDFVSDLQITKDRAVPVFKPQETETLFILTAHLKGYKRGDVKIDINEDGTLIAISGERRVKETVVVGRRVYKNETEVKRFRKVFRIPDGVILDEINAEFDHESTLTITMLKKVKGILGTAIEEIEGKPELVKGGSGNLHIAEETNRRAETSDQGRDGMIVLDNTTDDQMQAETHTVENEIPDREQTEEEAVLESQKPVGNEIQEITQTEQNKEHDLQESDKQDLNKANDVREEDKEGEEVQEVEPGKGPKREHRDKRCKMCIPIIAGSTLLLSFVVFVIQIIRSKNQTGRRRD